MALVNMSNLLRHAHGKRYAVDAYDIVDTTFLEAVLDGAEGSRAPVILSLAESHSDDFDFEALMPAVVGAARRARAPVAIHLDHGHSAATVRKAIGLGCNGVMLDALHLPLEKNLKATREAVSIARNCGVAVEGELGYVPGVEGEDAEKLPGVIELSSPEDAQLYVAATGVDCPAVSAGTVHRRQHGAPRLDYERLAGSDEALRIPLVSHGGTGLGDDQYRTLAETGVAKINYFTGLAAAAAHSILAEAGNAHRRPIPPSSAAFAPRSTGRAGCSALRDARTPPWPLALLGARWSPSSSIISEPCAAPVLDRFRGARRRGSQGIPGVRGVLAGRVLRANAPYRYCWLIRFAAPEVVASYRDHPDHLAYADGVFRPAAPDRITIDFELIDVLREAKDFNIRPSAADSSGAGT